MDRPEPGSSEQEYREWIESGGKLTEEQLQQVSALVQSEFPFAEGANPGEVVERVCWALGELVRARNSGVDEYAKKPNRMAAGEQLRALYQETETEDQFRERMHELGDLARCHHEHELGHELNDLGNSNTTWNNEPSRPVLPRIERKRQR